LINYGSRLNYAVIFTEIIASLEVGAIGQVSLLAGAVYLKKSHLKV